MGRMEGKVVIVTGGTRGMGEAEVRGLVREGAKVVFGGRDAQAGNRIEDELGGDAVYVAMELAPENIRVNIVVPGFFDTQILSEVSRGQGPELASRYVTGTQIRVDGAYTI